MSRGTYIGIYILGARERVYNVSLIRQDEESGR